MFKRMLLPTDGTDLSRRAVKKGIAFALEIQAEVIGFYCVEDYRGLMFTEYFPAGFPSEEEFQEQAKDIASKHLGFIDKTAQAAGVSCRTHYEVGLAPWEAIVEAAREKHCDLVFMASHGRRGLAGLLLGSQTNMVLAHSKVPVLVYR